MSSKETDHSFENILLIVLSMEHLLALDSRWDADYELELIRIAQVLSVPVNVEEQYLGLGF